MENRKRNDKPKSLDRKKTITKDKGKPKFADKKNSSSKSSDKPEFSDKKETKTSRPPFGRGGEGSKLPFKRKPLSKPSTTPAAKTVKRVDDGTMRLNRYIAHAGVCSRREADTLILSGAVSVNGVVVTELGTRVKEDDKVSVGNESIKQEQKVYLLMNKPKNFITSVSDPQGRKTVMQLVGKLKQRVYPVGRLDRDTTGVLMFTNDGDLAKKLTHPKHGIKKIYQVTLDKNVPQAHLKQIAEGIELEDGWIKADEVSYVGKKEDRREIGIEIHSGKNRIVRRIFEHLGYQVIKLDRVYFAGLTKKDLSRGQWRYLTTEELNIFKMLPK
ncbi:MAG: rRNA pseudouridine synthase [Flavobacteriales bacterium]|nr:rRNA pseudouridine synthase [Flavobacteriales bacterium]